MGKTIAIVGAGEGIGLAVAERFGREGFNVALLARSASRTRGIVDRLASRGVEAAAFEADILNREALIESLERAAARFGSIDVMEFSPTPTGPMPAPRQMSVEDQQYHLELNVLGPIAAVRAVLPEMLGRRSGSLLFTTAASAQRPLIMTAPFGVAAGALLNYVRILNRDVSADGVYAGIVSIAGLIVNIGQTEAANAAYFPAAVPRIKAEAVADLHWRLHSERTDCEVIIGDAERLYAIPGIR